MKKLNISEEEKKDILEQHQKSTTNEQIIWDKGNLQAIKSYQDIGKPDRKFYIKVEEPFELETTDADEFHKVRHILIKTHTKFTDEIKKIER